MHGNESLTSLQSYRNLSTTPTAFAALDTFSMTSTQEKYSGTRVGWRSAQMRIQLEVGGAEIRTSMLWECMGG